MKDQFGDRYDVLEASLQDIPRQIGARPKAVLVVTAHWEGPQFLVSASPQPGMIYDYSGFPPHTYQIQYPAPGAPALAAQVKQLLDTARPSGAPGPTSAASTTAPSAHCSPSTRRRTCRWCNCR